MWSTLLKVKIPFMTVDDDANDANDDKDEEEPSANASIKNPPIPILTIRTSDMTFVKNIVNNI